MKANSYLCEYFIKVNQVRILAKQTLIYGFGTIVPRFLNYGILTFLYTRIFNKVQYGMVTELYGWMVFLLIILTYGMETGFFRFAQKSENFEKVYSTTLLSLFVTSCLFIILINIFIEPVSAALKYSENQSYIRMFAAIVAIDAFSAIPFARLRKENKALIFSLVKILNVVITIIVVLIFLVIAPGKYESGNIWLKRIYNPDFGVGYVFLANLIGSVFTIVMLIPYIVKIKPVFDKKLWISMLGYSLPLMIAGLGGAINETFDKVIIRRIAGENAGLEMVGEYGAGYKIAVLMSLFIQMFRFAAEPFFFERAKTKGAKSDYAFVMRYFVIAMLIIYLVINLYISGFQYIIGQSFRESVKVVPIVSMGYLFYGIYVNHSIWYKLNDMTRYGIYITFFGAVITVLVNVIFIPIYGYMASAWAHVASYASMIGLSFILAERHYKINYQMHRLIPYFIIVVGILIFNSFIKYRSLVTELLISSLFLILFVIFAQYRDKLVSIFFSSSQK